MAIVQEGDNSKAKSALRDLHRIMDDSFVVGHIAVPLECCNATDDAAAAKKRMNERNFDVMGLRENGVITGYIRRDDVRTGHCRTYRKSFFPNDIIASRAPLSKLLPIMATRPQLFVLEHTEINGLVTRSDLQKSPVRMLLFGLLSLFEMYLLSMVRICYPAETLATMEDLADAQDLFRKRRQRNEDIDLADCLTLSEKSFLLLKVPGFATYFGLQDADRHFKNIESLRNKLAHAQDLVTGSTWERVTTTVLSIESFLAKCDDSYEDFESKFGKH
jgi:hypothetical protein